MTDGAISTGREPEAILSPSEPVPDRVERADLDYYPTPEDAVQPILPHLPRARRVFDPAAGQGELLRHFDAPTVTTGFELDANRARIAQRLGFDVKHADALIDEWPDADLVFMNPPFSHAEAFVRRALELRQRDPRVTIAVLLRLSWIEPTDPRKGLPGRRDLHAKHPFDCHVVPTRPHFRPNKHGKMGPDNVTAAWFLYGPGRGGRLFWL